jgi:predicted amidohydrolase YtcJ
MAGGRVAMHAVSEATVRHAVLALEGLAASGSIAERGHRIEHASICPPPLARRIARLGAMVVSNPGFLHGSGDRYRRELEARDLPHLYNIAELSACGVTVGAASDAPYSRIDPVTSICAATQRTSRSGARIPGALLAPKAALRAHTVDAARALGSVPRDDLERKRGTLRPGQPADLVVLSAPLSALHHRTDVHVEATMYEGMWHKQPDW